MKRILFAENSCPNDIDKMDAIQAKFEKLIGRPVASKGRI